MVVWEGVCFGSLEDWVLIIRKELEVIFGFLLDEELGLRIFM